MYIITYQQKCSMEIARTEKANCGKRMAIIHHHTSFGTKLAFQESWRETIILLVLLESEQLWDQMTIGCQDIMS